MATAWITAMLTKVDAATTTALKVDALLGDMAQEMLIATDSRGDENYPQARRTASELWDEILAAKATIATSMDANIA